MWLIIILHKCGFTRFLAFWEAIHVQSDDALLLKYLYCLILHNWYLLNIYQLLKERKRTLVSCFNDFYRIVLSTISQMLKKKNILLLWFLKDGLRHSNTCFRCMNVNNKHCKPTFFLLLYLLQCVNIVSKPKESKALKNQDHLVRLIRNEHWQWWKINLALSLCKKSNL
jgi:hypothetical protein